MSTLRIALAQINPIMGDFDYNVNLVKDYIHQAKAIQCDLVIFPEMVLCGYPPEDLLLRPGFINDAKQAFEAIQSESNGISIIVGFPEPVDGLLYNTAALITNGQTEIMHHKIELPNYGVFDEKRYFTGGERPIVVEFNQVKFALTICEDIWVNNGVCERYLKDLNLDYIINLAASPFHIAKLIERQNKLIEFGRKTKAGMIYVNLLGGQDELVFDGGSMMIDKDQQLIMSAGHTKETLLIADVVATQRDWPASFKPDLITISGDQTKKVPIMAKPLPSTKSTIAQIHDVIVMGTKDYVRKNNFKKIIVGLSGGIDSAVTAALAVEALGAKNVLAVSMPSTYSSNETQQDAQLCAKKLNISCDVIPIDKVFTAYQSTLNSVMQDGPPGLEMENLQARIRGNYLMALSNKYGYLVLTTGNKSETAVGYCTLYGDMAGGFALIKDVYKTTVYELAHYINMSAKLDLIPQTIIDRAPSAELRADQKDEDSLPPYAILDPILKAYIEEGLSPDEIIKLGYDQQLVLEIIRLVDRNEYKRRQAPPGIKITPKAFGRDWRLPISNQYCAHLIKQFTQ